MNGATQNILIDKTLLTELQTLACCPSNEEDCVQNTFCLSEPAAWPSLEDGQTLLAYPESPRSESVAGTADFCDVYINWLDRLRLEPTATSHSYFLAARNPEELNELANFCVGVEATRKNHYSSIAPKMGDSDDDVVFPALETDSLFGGGFKKFISENKFRLAVVVATLVNFVAVWLGFSVVETLDENPRSIYRTFRNWKNLVRLFQKPPGAAISQKVVLAQLKRLLSEGGNLPEEKGLIFKTMGLYTRHFVAHLLVKEWNDLWRFTKNAFIILAEDKNYPPNGVPFNFIESLTKVFLNEGNVASLKARTRTWVVAKMQNTKLDAQTVAAQLEIGMQAHGEFKNPVSPAELMALARKAIEKWLALTGRKKAEYIDIHTQILNKGLPSKFIIEFVEDHYRSIEDTRHSSAGNNPDDGSSTGGTAPPQSTPLSPPPDMSVSNLSPPVMPAEWVSHPLWYNTISINPNFIPSSIYH